MLRVTKTQMTKVSVSLPASLVDDLDYLGARLGVSRSAMIAELLTDSVAEMRKIVALVPPNPTPAELLRMRGESESVIRDRISQVKGMTNDLFARK